MANIVFTDGSTVIPASWLNDVNTVVYSLFGNGTSLTNPSKLTVGSLEVSGDVNSAAFISATGVVAFWRGRNAADTAYASSVYDSTQHIFRVAGNEAFRFDVNKNFIAGTDNSFDIGAAGATRPRTGYFGTSVVTPALTVSGVVSPSIVFNPSSGATKSGQIYQAGNLIFFAEAGVANRFQWNIDGSSFAPSADNVSPLGGVTNRWSSIYTPILDSGTTGSLSLRTNNGQTGFRVDNGGAVNFLATTPGASGTFASLSSNVGQSDANAGISFFGKGTGSFDFYTRADVAIKQQFSIIDTAGSTRWITITGSNGGNPTISTTAGDLNIGVAIKGASGTVALSGATSTSGTGIAFPATQSASTDANTLDDYEEGTWTPGISFGGGTTGITYTSQTGQYTKVGRQVFLHYSIVLSSKGTSTGTANITGLPFTVSASQTGACATVRWTAMTSSLVNLIASPAGSLTTCTLEHLTAAATSFTTTSDVTFGNTTGISGTLMYFV